MAAASQMLVACAEPKSCEINGENDPGAEQVQRAQWLRAAILGATDGLLSTTLLMLGVGAVKEDRQTMILSGLAGAFAGACSMAVGEFVSVSTQRDIERASTGHPGPTTKSCGDLDHGQGVELQIPANPTNTTEIKLIDSRVAWPPVMTREPLERVSPVMTPGRKLTPGLSPRRSPMMRVIEEDARTTRTKVDAEDNGKKALPNPYKAAAASALAFLCGSLVPLVSAIFVVPNKIRTAVIAVVASVALPLFGGVGACIGGSPIWVSAGRVLVGGWITMAITYGLLKPLDRDQRVPDAY